MSDDSRPSDEALAELPTMAGHPRPAPGPALPLPREIGGFRIVGKLGEGGMGIVYEAEQQNPRRRVALKVLRGAQILDEVSLRMFERESETLARLAHPNIAAIYEAGRTEDGLHFFTMELVAGRPLSAWAREELGGERPNLEQLRARLRAFVSVCRAVNHAHQRGVIHRDLKPSNLVVNAAGEVRVLDFGLARVIDTEAGGPMPVSEVGVIKGTLPYMSPEQARGHSRDVDLRTDVYSLGVVLYEMISGRTPYEVDHSSIMQAVRTICEEAPRPLDAATLGFALDPDVRTIVTKALEKEPERRYQSAGALADDVERWLEGHPILAHPPSAAYLVRKYVARHRGRVAALGAIALLALALLVTLGVQARRVRIERDRARLAAAKAEAVDRFLLDALGAADPWGKGSRSVTLLDALHVALGRTHAAFRDQPLAEAEVLQTLGSTFGGLGEFALADSALQRSLALRRSATGPNSSEAAAALNALATLNVNWQRYPEAEAYARRADSIATVVDGPGGLLTASAQTNLATAYSKEAKYPAADSLAQRVIANVNAHRAAHGDAMVQGIDPRQLLSIALQVRTEVALAAGDGKAMVRLDRERLALIRDGDVAHDATMVSTLNDLASGEMVSGDLPAAQRDYERALALSRATFGDEHPTTALLRENLGNVYYRQGRLDQTAAMLEQVLASRRRALGEDAEPVARTLANMATVYRKAGRLAESERTYHQAIPLLEARLGPTHPDVGLVRMALGMTLRDEERFAEAEVTLRRAITILHDALGDPNPSTQRALAALADTYTKWGKPALAAGINARIAPVK